jgi:hypothetical protein
MDNWFIFQYRPLAVMSDGVTRGEGCGAALELLSSKPADGGAGKSTLHIRRGAMGSPEVTKDNRAGTCRQEKPLSQANGRPYRKPTQVGGGKYPKVNGRTSVKELGKLTP